MTDDLRAILRERQPMVLGGLRRSDVDRLFRVAPALDMSERTALYRLVGDAGRLLYVGVARDPFARLEQHVKAKEWWPEVTHSHIEWYATRTDALDAELFAIRTERPTYNIQSVGGARSRRRTPPRPPEPVEPGTAYWRKDDA